MSVSTMTLEERLSYHRALRASHGRPLQRKLADPNKEWRPVASVDEGRWVSRDGQVKDKYGRLLTPHPFKGYLKVSCFRNGKRFYWWVHRAVLEAFGGPQPSPSHQCRHLSGDKADNRIENLAWGTPKENSADRVAHGTQVSGERCHTAVLTAEDVIAIRASSATPRELSELYGITTNSIRAARKGKSWRAI